MLSNLDVRSTLQTNELCFVKFSYILSNFTFSGGWVVQNQDERPTQSIVRLKLRLNLAILPSLSFYYSLVHYFPGWVGGSTEKLRIKTISAQLKLKLGLSLAKIQNANMCGFTCNSKEYLKLYLTHMHKI